ncbi:MAG: ABC transporter substrate-binding protein [Deltaproteobacteria bacterium]|nr:ABC transporter substrate-binding protein [Deltaproteobacteria bacterium]
MSISGDIKIVIAEDAVTMRKIEVNTLKKLGFENVMQAGDGKEAIDIIQKQGDVDLVISDWNMPNMGGDELVIWLRAQEQFKGIPFLMATGQSDKSQSEKAMRHGANALIAKPFSQEELKAKIDEVMGEGSAGEEDGAGLQVGVSGKIKLRVAHIQITDHLVLGVLKHWIANGKVVPEHFELETQCKQGWNPVQDSLDRGTVDAACILAPIAMDLFNYGVPLKLVLFAHRSGSIFVRSKQGDYTKPYQNFFKQRSFLLPHKMSVHHMLTHMFFKGIGLNASLNKGDDVDVNLEVVAPINMPPFLRDNANACGFMVAEPIGTKAIAAGIAEQQFLSHKIWRNHPCCVVTMRNDFVEAHKEAVYEFTDLLVKAGKFIAERPDTAADIAVEFLDPDKKLGLKAPILRNVLTDPEGIKTNDLYPSKDDLDKMQRYMHDEMEVGSLVDLDKFIDTQYADAACAGMPRSTSVLMDSAELVEQILQPTDEKTERSAKAMLEQEGRYLTFILNNQEFGINIFKVREIIKMMEFVKVHQAPPYAKGVINLRDKVIPVLDMRAKLGMEEVEYTDRSCIVIVETSAFGGSRQVGLAVDSVSEVISFKSADIEDPPTLGAGIDTNYILGMAKTDTDVKILLDIDQAINY